jgi:hypothetical protein
MTRPTRLEINCETGVESIIELTDAEIAQMEADAAEAAARQHEAEVKAAADAEAKAALLAKLGITEDEAKLLLA